LATFNQEVFLEFDFESEKSKIPLTKYNANKFKKVFNKIILKLKKGKYNFKLEEVGQDLYLLRLTCLLLI
jgi:hypothetical protein